MGAVITNACFGQHKELMSVIYREAGSQKQIMVKDKKKSSMQTEDDPFGIWMNTIKDLEGIKR